LAYNVALYAAKKHEVVVVDMDAAQGLTICANKREVSADNLLLLEGVVSVTSAIEKLLATSQAAYLIVDAPKSLASKMRDAIAAADCIVLPVKPSPVDVLVNEEVVTMVRELNKVDRALFVVNSVDKRSSIGQETFEIMAAKSPHRPVKITELVDYKRSLIAGLAAFEVSKVADTEISGLWDAIQHILARKTDHVDKANNHARPEAGPTGQGPGSG
jgi:chromosome partitioning protein